MPKDQTLREDIRIVILDRGWVAVGRWSKAGSECRLDGAYIIRIWGTERGLGQLAMDGPLKSTVLDPVTILRYHELNAVADLQCTHPKWADLCK
jgi:hypothetical protein